MLTVIGLTSSQGLTTGTFDHIGLATIGGNHMMLRGYADVEEREIFERAFKKLSAGERERLYTARRRHKGAAVLLHELGHNLGAPHTVLADTLMYPTYSDRSAAFDPDSRTIMRARVDRVLGRTPRDAVPAPSEAAAKHPVVAITTLDGILKLSFDDDHDTQVVVKTARGAPHAIVVKVLDHAKAVGLTHMAIAN